MRFDAFRSAEEFKKNMDNWIRRFRSDKTVEGEERVYIHGDIEREITEVRMNEGIPLIRPVENDLMQLGKKFNISLA